MSSLADDLPPENARQVHPDWRKNEGAYWTVRDQLLPQYQGQWIGFADGKVVASGSRPVVVFHAAHQAAQHPYVVCVGREGEPYRMRRVSFAYDTSYPGEALPVVRAEFRRFSGVTSPVFDQVIVDTGADISALPWADCQILQLDPAQDCAAREQVGLLFVSPGLQAWEQRRIGVRQAFRPCPLGPRPEGLPRSCRSWSQA